MQEQDELLKVQTSPFSSTTQPFKENPSDFKVKIPDTLAIAGDPVVGVMSPQFVGRCSHQLCSRQGTIDLEPLLVEFQLSRKAFADRLATDTK